MPANHASLGMFLKQMIFYFSPNKKQMKSLTLLLILFSSFQAFSQPIKSYEEKMPLSTPKIFAEGIISTGDYDSHPEFSITGDTLYFVKSGPDVSKWTICVSYYRNKKWSAPEVAPFSGQYMDADPFFTKDGKTLYFTSNRPAKIGVPKEDMDIWKLEKTIKGWSDPIWLNEPFNSDKSEYYPTLADNGTMYFGSRREGGKGGADIYKSELINGKYQSPVNLGDAINTAGSEYEPLISFDEKFMIFLAARPDDLVNADLFISYNHNGQWTPAEKLPLPFNTEVTEFSPKITRDRKYFFFGSARNINPSTTTKRETMADVQKRIHSAGNGLCDIYQIDFSTLKIKEY